MTDTRNLPRYRQYEIAEQFCWDQALKAKERIEYVFDNANSPGADPSAFVDYSNWMRAGDAMATQANFYREMKKK